MSKNQNPRKKELLWKWRASLSFLKRKALVFVDDVLTTGSTARAAFQALDKPENFFVFTLVWRRARSKKTYF